MAQKLAWGRSWHGRSYDLGRMTLADLWRAYLTYPAIQLYAALAVAAAVYAVVAPEGIAAGHWLAPLVAVVAVFFVYPMAWFFIHRYILHGRWLYRIKWTATLWKRIHFDHHQDPHLLEVLFGSPVNTLPTIAGVTMPIGYAIGGWPAAAAALSMGLFLTCTYEFIHCIQHLNYKPRNQFIQKLKRDHLIHHFHNEDTNLGIVSFTPDRIFGTYFASARDCPKSATVFNLGYDVEEARRYPWVMEATGAPPRDRPPSAFATSETRGTAS